VPPVDNAARLYNRLRNRAITLLRSDIDIDDWSALDEIAQDVLQGEHAREELEALLALILVLDRANADSLRTWLRGVDDARGVLEQIAGLPRFTSIAREALPRFVEPPPSGAVPLSAIIDPITRTPRSGTCR
jgi:hypothetical protein